MRNLKFLPAIFGSIFVIGIIAFVAFHGNFAVAHCKLYFASPPTSGARPRRQPPHLNHGLAPALVERAAQHRV